MPLEEVRKTLQSALIGQEEVIEQILLTLLAGGHALLEGVPGVGKTLLARTLAQTLGLSWARLQFTPDMLPSDVTGSVMYDMKNGEFRVERGPVFAHVILADEINRTPPKTQSALLEAMEEGQVTLYGTTLQLPDPFFVIATQNPVEYEGTYPLPEAQLDRFLAKVSIGYPGLDEEVAMLGEPRPIRTSAGRPASARDQAPPPPAEDAALAVRDLQSRVAGIEAAAPVLRYIAEISGRTRQHPGVNLGASPRASKALLAASRAAAFLAGRPFVTPDDVKRTAQPVLAHRLIVSPSAELEGVTSRDIVDEILSHVAVPR